MDKHLLEKLIDEYGKLVDYTIMIDNPTFLDLFKNGFECTNNHLIFQEKPKFYVGMIFLLLCDIHEINDELYIKEGLKKIRVYSYKNDLVGYMKLCRTTVLENLQETHLDKETLLIGEVMDFLETNGVKELVEFNLDDPFSHFYVLQDSVKPDKDMAAYVNDLVFDLFEFRVEDRVLFSYNLVSLCPLAHSALALFLNVEEISEYKQLLNVIIRGFEILHAEELKRPIYRFYYHENFRDYILALESLASIEKFEGDHSESIKHYQKALEYDDLDVLHIKRSILLPLLAEGEFETFLDYAETLNPESVTYNYIQLFNGLVNKFETLDYTLYENALKSSPKIMEILCTNADLYKQCNREERKYLEDFYGIWLMQEDFIEELKTLYFRQSVA